jgi:hypothetical protein
MSSRKIVIAMGTITALAGLAQLHAQQTTPDASNIDFVAGSMNQPVPQTRLEKLFSMSGVLITRGYTDVGGIQGDDRADVRILAIEASSPSEKFYGVGFQLRPPDRPRELVEAFVDEDGIDSLIAALDSLEKIQRDSTKMANTQATYRTPGGLEFSNMDSDGARLIVVRAIQVLPTGQISESGTIFRPNRLEEIRRLIRAAKERVDAVKK